MIDSVVVNGEVGIRSGTIGEVRNVTPDELELTFSGRVRKH